MKKQVSAILASLMALSMTLTALASENSVPGCSYIKASQALTETREYTQPTRA